MSISINTSEYKQVKEAVIDGIKFEVRPMSSAESLTMTAVGQDMIELEKTSNIEEITKKMNEFSDLFFSLFEPRKEAEKIIKKLPYEAWLSIYKKIMEFENEPSGNNERK